MQCLEAMERKRLKIEPGIAHIYIFILLLSPVSSEQREEGKISLPFHFSFLSLGSKHGVSLHEVIFIFVIPVVLLLSPSLLEFGFVTILVHFFFCCGK